MAWLRGVLCGAEMLAVLAASAEAFADCYVDSVEGNDSLDGSSEATAVQSQAPLSGCGTVYYKRGSTFSESVKTSAGSVFTNYGDSGPLPAFITTESVVNSFQGGITIDGLHLEGSSGDGSMQGMGVCVMLGVNSQLLNSEITDCDIGIMLFGDNSLVQGNVIYDLFRMAVDSSDPDVYANSVGGAEGIFVNGSNNEVAYNSFINCKAEAQWQSQGDQVGYDGGATEVAVSEGGEVTGLRVHHNFSYNNCGFFEVSGFGVFSDSEFHYNVSIDSAWAMLLQVNETTLRNIRWENNTFVHHADAYTPSIAMIYQAELEPNTVTFNNNMVIFDGANMFNAELDPAFSASNNLIVDHDPGVANLAGTTADAFDLVAGSEAIDQGLNVPTHTLDFLNRTVPDPSGMTDIGAFEYGSTQGAELPETAELPEGAGTPPPPGATGSPGTPGGIPPAGTDSAGTAEGASGCACSAVGESSPARAGRLGLLLAAAAWLLGRRRRGTMGQRS
jgi:MYXO-CTERM domain-containing protein